MTDLNQQLEDKKKGCGKKFDTEVGNTFDEYYICQKRGLCPTCQAEIAILEQAIAEMQKQRQEDIKFLEELTWVIVTPNLKKLVYNRIEQLNQPKTEKENSKQ